ncbi:hypothetical protein KSP39_PZI016787 [Platanthera zijinensis]|uniref:Uncharacterized protein n=1 Tax=Platanthera zijinensis TaxID=2320716 RepID=A0AAP0B711_9ASPA
MRGLNRFAASPRRPIAAALSTFSGGGGDGGGGGRGRGRGAGFPPTPSPQTRVPGQPDGEDSLSSSFGHGRGHPPFPSPPGLPPLTPSAPSIKPSFSPGHGRGRGSHPPSSPGLDHSQPKQPIFFRRPGSDSPPADSGESAALPRSLPPPILSGSGRGKPIRSAESDPRPVEVNRHLPNRTQPTDRSPPSSPTQRKLGSEEALKKAMEVLSRGGPSGAGGRGRGGRGMAGRGRGRGRGDRFGGGRGRRDSDEGFDLYVGDDADGEKLEKMLGESKMKLLTEGFEEIGLRVLPSPMDEAYLDALHTNNLIEYEPEYIMEFDRNPDIDEKPPMTLEEALAVSKPFLMAYTGMKSQEEWEHFIGLLSPHTSSGEHSVGGQLGMVCENLDRSVTSYRAVIAPTVEALAETKTGSRARDQNQARRWNQARLEEAIEDLRERLPHLKELVDRYSGPDRVTAKQQQEELERVAKTLPENIPASVKRFTDRAVISLQVCAVFFFLSVCYGC